METESQEVVKVGIELIVGAIFMFLAVSLMLTAHHWYAREEYSKYQTQYQAENSPDWTFRDRAKNVTANESRPAGSKLPETVQGNDVVNFIVRNGSKYEYVIGTGSFDKSGSDTHRLTAANCEAIGANEWNYKPGSSNYSERTDITKYNFSSNDWLSITRNDNPNVDERGGNTGVRVYGQDLINRRAEAKQRKLTDKGLKINYGSLGLDIYSENYLVNTAGLGDHLEGNFRVICDINNGEVVRWYFLLDTSAKDTDTKGR